MKLFFQKYKKRIIIWTIIIFVFVIIIPLVINWMFAIPALLPIFAVSWSAADALAFYSSILGAAATIYVLSETMRFTIRNQKEERKLSIRPYLNTRKRYYNNKTSEIPLDNDFLYLEVHKGKLEYQEGLPKEISNMVKSYIDLHTQYHPLEALIRKKVNNQIAMFFQNNYLLYYEIANCGAGNAIDVTLSVGDVAVIPAFCITTDTPKKVLLNLSNDLMDDGVKTIVISMEYSDIASLGKYKQEESFIFSRDASGALQTAQTEENLLITPIEIP